MVESEREMYERAGPSFKRAHDILLSVAVPPSLECFVKEMQDANLSAFRSPETVAGKMVESYRQIPGLFDRS